MADPVELGLRVGVFVLALLVLLIAERRWPLQAAPAGRWRSRRDNLLLFVTSAVCTRVLLPAGGVGVAFLAARHGIGLSAALHWRLSVAFVLTLLVLDAAVYLQHRFMHYWPPLWRLHRVHHSDRFLDATSALRFHPGEIVLSALYKSLIIVALGAPPAAVLCFELLLNTSALFNHSNLALSPRVERGLRRLVVTPAMHWIHHSILPRESRHNFGFCLSVWDRLFGSYQDSPRDAYGVMVLGIEGLEEEAPGVLSLLSQPRLDIAAPAAGSYSGAASN